MTSYFLVFLRVLFLSAYSITYISYCKTFSVCQRDYYTYMHWSVEFYIMMLKYLLITFNDLFPYVYIIFVSPKQTDNIYHCQTIKS